MFDISTRKKALDALNGVSLAVRTATAVVAELTITDADSGSLFSTNDRVAETMIALSSIDGAVRKLRSDLQDLTPPRTPIEPRKPIPAID